MASAHVLENEPVLSDAQTSPAAELIEEALDLGGQLRALRERRSLSQPAVSDLLEARGLSVSKSSVSSWERNKSVPNATALAGLASVYGTTFVTEGGKVVPLDRTTGRLLGVLLSLGLEQRQELASSMQAQLMAAMRLRVRSQLEQTPAFCEREVRELLGAEEFVRALSSGELIRFEREGAWRYPRFQFSLRDNCVFPVVGRVNRLLEAESDPYGVLGWWTTPNTRASVGGTPPVELLWDQEFERVESLARTVVDWVD